MKRFSLLVAGLFLLMPAFAQTDSLPQKNNRFTIGAELWTRGEWRDGALPADNGKDDAWFIMESTTLSVSYRHKGLEVKIAPKHAGIWGSAGGGSFSLDEGWFSLTHRNGLFLKVGRQKIAYDDERIIGNDDWAMAAARHDLLKMGYEGDRHKVHLMAAFNQNDENVNGGTYYVNGGQPYKAMQTLWYHFDAFPWLGASLIFINTGMQCKIPGVNETKQQQLFGGFLDVHPKNLSVQASYYRQTGRDEWKLPIHAWMASIEAAWQIHPRFCVNTGYFHMSGDKYYYVPKEGAIGMARKTEVCGFNPIFGSHHQFYGAMDFFYLKTYYGGNTPGLQDFHAGVRWSPIGSLDLKASYHYLATSVQVADVKKTLGHELEFTASWQISPVMCLEAGYSHMKGTETMARLKRSHDKNLLNWGWLMLTVTPEFFSYQW